MTAKRRILAAISLGAASAAIAAGALVSQQDATEIRRGEAADFSGSMQAVRGIRGIEAVRLQNLEAVLRMQSPPLPPVGGGGGVRAAAALLTTESAEPLDMELEIDGREELAEVELEGS